MRKLLVLVLFLLCISSSVAHARYRELNAIIFNPVTDGGKYLTIQESSSLPQWHFNFGVLVDYAREPLQVNTSTGRRPVVDDQLVTNLNGAIGFTDWLELGVNLPIITWETWASPDVAAITKENKYGLGDLRVETKFRILDVERYHVGIAVVPFITFPTVTSSLQSQPNPAGVPSAWFNGAFASNEVITGGGKLVIEGDIANRVWLALNAGYQLHKYRQYYPTNPDAFVDNLLLLGGAAHVRITDAWRVIAEMNTETVAKPFSNAFRSKRQTPVEVDGAVRWEPAGGKGLAVTAGAGRGIITAGVGAPNLRVFMGLNYRKPKIVELPPPPPPAEVEVKSQEKIIITQKIHFEFNKANIRPISFPILNDVVTLLNKNPEIKKIEIGGHCDSIGGDAYNLKLSQKRAQSVVNYLVKNGVDSSRLVAKGYGKSAPIADNNTTEGRAKNRRVEFTVLE